MLSRLASGLLFTTIVFLTGCGTAPLEVVHVQKEGFNEGKYISFKVSHSHVDIATKAEELINKAIADVMTEKGYVDGANADFEIRYSLKTMQSQRLEIESVAPTGPAWQGGAQPAGHPPQMEAVFEARMLVNVIDTKTGEVIWKAASNRDLTQVDVSKFDSNKAHDRMHEMFENFPARYWW
ncbi:hypothetical protein A3742_08265 [Oleiphilus sp. HI0071]|jgi:PBP1b-binding outer membrane lipoprotein LpoB|uniref:DUF4136 domain-containing protein n=1 Tax=unclassified Oleiphilus TaxID=2631174 RepID=UPI0007C38240|nr:MULTISPECIES: DUF4136 domain-containing protein [unclassified Oleiphilus]KZY72559.1 hypothetical protein A3737_10630 [Oleiphilus sp. HI0065]KZY82862.1 hypothetical protein A3742_08265 [Oleiphilus sp. HI0071]KZZ04826.1 hypothetical protein A3744_09105 [Oleiphilus sp. HI0073]KZZ41188.1 hypothetical protein A3758_23530 [Oleiphilus sp. HI0118]KZZ49168.1 hypothetical protein A3760_02970 [Oleiphilus sp. HI0122]KZZ80262.1 hypothetical protein A3767_00830 [Oleiphilus sp. HI0133]